ncbi:MAG TPA: aldolase/citrate lyase family protein [Caulobacteraceae bacterium]|jgi:2-keto-3-deoxy-L-rhamnonate aldolase RhmA|nr:aldolase/citrate lyase family protein [Caulobacteraceae bacterium]
MDTSIGTFIKTAAPELVEILGLAGLDFLAVDAEHAPFGRRELDLMMLAARAAATPMYVRIPDDRATTILQALDVGADGLIVPHVDSAAQAAAVVRSAKFAGGDRGFSNAARFGRYGTTTIDQAVEIGDQAKIICQIESPQAVAAAEEIAATPGVSGLLVGRADLALSMGLRRLDADEVQHGARTAISAARKHGKLAGIVAGDTAEIAPWLAAGANFFIVAHDQGFLRKAVSAMATAARAAIADAS